MDSFEVNKIVGALLASILLVLVIGLIGNSLYQVEMPEKPVYTVAGPAEEEAGGGETAAAGEEAGAPETPGGSGAESGGGPALAALLASADPAAGRKVAKKCAACHSFDKGGKNKVGPNLWDVVGAPKASREGYSYSGALSALGGEWTYQDLDAFLAAPKAFVPGTKMGFAGLKKPSDRAAVIAFLRSLSDDPKPLP